MANRKQIEMALLKVLMEWGIKNVNISDLIVAIRSGNADSIVDILGVTPEALSPVLSKIVESYVDAGQIQANKAPKSVVGSVSFGMGNPQVVEFLRRKQYDLIQNISVEQRENIRTILSEVSTQRKNPLEAVKQMIGVKGPTGKRIGSVIGLSSPQLVYVTNARNELSDPALMHKYLKRERRDKRLDAMVRKAMRDGQPLRPEDADRAAAAYADRLLRLRAETIARTEHKDAVSSARMDSIASMVESGKLREDQVKRIWDATDDIRSFGGRTRLDHRKMDGQTVVGLKEPFRTPDGYRLMFPGDGRTALAKHVANCRCVMRIEIDYYAGLE